jgi:hypothetical protein
MAPSTTVALEVAGGSRQAPIFEQSDERFRQQAEAFTRRVEMATA